MLKNLSEMHRIVHYPLEVSYWFVLPSLNFCSRLQKHKYPPVGGEFFVGFEFSYYIGAQIQHLEQNIGGNTLPNRIKDRRVRGVCDQSMWPTQYTTVCDPYATSVIVLAIMESWIFYSINVLLTFVYGPCWYGAQYTSARRHSSLPSLHGWNVSECAQLCASTSSRLNNTQR